MSYPPNSHDIARVILREVAVAHGLPPTEFVASIEPACLRDLGYGVRRAIQDGQQITPEWIVNIAKDGPMNYPGALEITEAIDHVLYCWRESHPCGT